MEYFILQTRLCLGMDPGTTPIAVLINMYN